MSSRTILSVLVAILLVSSVVAPIGAVAAQESANETETDGASDEATPRESDERAETEEQKDEEEITVVEEVDDSVRVTGYSYNRETEIMTVQFANVGEETTDVTMTEVITERDADSGTMGVEMFRLRPDEEISVEIYTKSGAVMIVTEQSLERGQGTYLRDDSRYSLLSGPATWGLIRVSGFGGALGVLVLAVLLGWHRIADSTDKVEVNA